MKFLANLSRFCCGHWRRADWRSHNSALSGWIAAFVLFRVFDILKPGPIRTIDKKGPL